MSGQATVAVFKPLQLPNAYSIRVVTDDGIATLDKPLQYPNADWPMNLTVFGIVTPVSPAQLEKA